MTLRLPLVRVGAAMLALMLSVSACGGGGGAVSPSSHVGSTSQGATVSGTASLVIPNRTVSTTARTRHTQFVSPSAMSVGLSINGGAQAFFDVSSSSPLCTVVSGGRSCTLPLSAPPGSDTFTLNVYDAAGGTGTLLGSGTAMTMATAGQAFAVSVAMSPVVATVSNPFVTYGAGSAFEAGTAGSATVAFTLMDPDGNVITPSTTPSFASPLTLTSSDPHVTVTPSSWTSPSQMVSPIRIRRPLPGHGT